MVEESKKNFYYKFLYNPFPVESCLLNKNGKLWDNINAEIAIGTIASISDAVGYLDWTYLGRRIAKNPLYYGVPTDKEEDVTMFFWETLKTTLLDLEVNGCIDIDRHDSFGDDYSINTTLLGQAASSFYLNYKTPVQMRNGMRLVRQAVLEQLELSRQSSQSATDNITTAQKKSKDSKKKKKNNFDKSQIENYAIANILYVLSSTQEFNDVPPVRHNEDLLNAELCAKLPWGATPPQQQLMQLHDSTTSNGPNTTMIINANAMGDSHTKCYLLLQAHVFHTQLPTSDYIMDLHSVMEQVPRLLAAMEFICVRDAVLNKNEDEARGEKEDWSMKHLLHQTKKLLRVQSKNGSRRSK